MRRKKRPSMDGLVDRSRSRRSAAGTGGGGGSELFICFTSLSSASSSSSMRASAAANAAATSSKSLLSPGRSRDASAAPSLSSSLSRRLRSSGSVKGAQSPMFPLVSGGSRRKGPAFEAAEPSSPKVTCIGQVRVRSKKKKKKAAAAAAAAAAMRSRSMRGAEASFRRTSTGSVQEVDEECLPNKNQRWVYELPVSICEALRNFGSEFSCFFPCGGKSFCSKTSSRSPEGTDRGVGRYCGKGAKRSTSSCGGVIARWLMAMEEDEEEEVGRRVDVVSRRIEERTKEDRLEAVTTMREEAFGYEYNELEKDEKKEEVGVVDEAEQEARVSVCVPPPNALLLMRCRSDPVRMAALATRFWDSPAMKVHVQEGHGRQNVDEEEEIDIDEMREKVDDMKVHVEEEQYAQDHERPEAEVVDADEVVVTKTVVLVDQKEKDIAGTIQGMVLEEGVGGKESHENELLEKQQSPNEVKLNEHLGLHIAAVAGLREAQRRSSVDQEEVAAVPAVIQERPEAQRKIQRILITNEANLVDGQQEEEIKGRRSSSCSSTADKEERKSVKCHGKAKDGGRRHSRVFREKDKRRHSFSTDGETRRPSFSNEKEARRASFSIEGKRRWSFCIDSKDLRLEKKALEEERKKKEQERSLEVKALEKIDGSEAKVTPEEEAEAIKVEECIEELGNTEREEDRRRNWVPEEQTPTEKKSNELPDCLLLMMYEPKLSMEVSKETWVCSNDFLRWRPNYRLRQPSKGISNNDDSATVGSELSDAKVEAKTKSNEDKCSDNKELITMVEPAPQRSLPPAPAPPAIENNPNCNMVALQAQVLPPAPAQATTATYGPFVLTRCKSEPMRSSARLTPNACFWKDRHRPIGATGIGF